MKIKVLKPVRLHKDLTEYRETKDSKLVTYQPDDIVLDVNDEYVERYSAYSEHIEILEGPKDVTEDYVENLKKKEVETHLEELGVEYDSKAKIGELKEQLIEIIKANKGDED